MRQVIMSKTPADSPIPAMCFGLELNDQECREYIAKRAYFKSAARGYQPGHEIEDWLEAESEILAEFKRTVRK